MTADIQKELYKDVRKVLRGYEHKITNGEVVGTLFRIIYEINHDNEVSL